MRFTTTHRPAKEPPVLPLINIVFLLLIFFMVAGRLTPADPLAVDPPRSASEGRADAAALFVHVDALGRMALDGRIVDAAELRASLAARLAGGGDLPLQLVADGTAEASGVVAVMELAREAGIERLSLRTRPLPCRASP